MDGLLELEGDDRPQRGDRTRSRRRCSSSYDEPAVKKALPYSAELLNAVKEAVPRPVSPVYPQISEAVYKNVNEALTGQESPEDALKKGNAQIDKALASF